jgi:hypothetical protein
LENKYLLESFPMNLIVNALEKDPNGGWQKTGNIVRILKKV